MSVIDFNAPTPRENTWMTSLLEFILNAWLLEELDQAQKMKRHAHQFVVLNGALYRRSYQDPMLKCVSTSEAEYVLKEIMKDVA